MPQVKTLRVKMFGPFEVCRGQEPIPENAWGRRKTKDLLKVLLSERGRAFTVDQLVERLYPDADPDKVVKNLRGRVSRLRKALEPDLQHGRDSQYILSPQGGYCFDTEADCWVDVEVFEQHLNTAQDLFDTQRFAQALEEYDRSIELYRGDFLEEDAYEDWVLDLRQRLEKRYLDALENMARCHGRLREYRHAISACDRIISLQPYRERAFRLKMRYLFHAGQRQQAIETYAACAQLLKDRLGREPSPETKKLHLQINKGQLPEETQTVPNNLPIPLTTFVGRDEELEVLLAHLGDLDCRLLTVVGPGGIGKTRLALQAASRCLDRYPDGVFWVSLAGLAAAELIPSAIAEALKFNFYDKELPQLQLTRYLSKKHLLLILDNFEHLVDGVPVLLELLQKAPYVQCLVTSRVRLKVQSEWVFPLEGLSTPNEDALKDLREYDAVKLFLNSVRKTETEFSLTDKRKASMVRICQLVDGVPLAIELAAAWAGVLSCDEISDEIERNLDFLATDLADLPERQRSVRATFEHSWQLLSSEDKAILSKLAVFQGGFTHEAAAWITGSNLKSLSSLLDKSLLKRAGTGRLSSHDLLRQFAEEKLKKHPNEHLRIQQNHAQYYLTYLNQREDDLQGQRQVAALNEIAAEMDNVRAAWDWAIKNQGLSLLNLAADGLYSVCNIRNWLQEGEERFGQLADHLQATDVEQEGAHDLLITALSRQGAFLLGLGHPDSAQGLVEQSMKLLPAKGRQAERAFSLNTLGLITYNKGEYTDAKKLFESSLQLSQALNDQPNMATVLGRLARVAESAGNYQACKRLHRQSLTIGKEIGNQWLVAVALNNLGLAALCLGELKEATNLFQESLKINTLVSDQRGIAGNLGNLGVVAWELKDFSKAQCLCQESLAIIEKHLNEPYIIGLTHANLGGIACDLGQYEAAQTHLQTAMQVAVAQQYAYLAMDTVLYSAILLSKIKKQQRALELFFFAWSHPAIDPWSIDRAKPVFESLKAELSKKAVEAARQNAQSITLDDIWSDLLQGLL